MTTITSKLPTRPWTLDEEIATAQRLLVAQDGVLHAYLAFVKEARCVGVMVLRKVSSEDSSLTQRVDWGSKNFAYAVAATLMLEPDTVHLVADCSVRYGAKEEVLSEEISPNNDPRSRQGLVFFEATAARVRVISRLYSVDDDGTITFEGESPELPTITLNQGEDAEGGSPAGPLNSFVSALQLFLTAEGRVEKMANYPNMEEVEAAGGWRRFGYEYLDRAEVNIMVNPELAEELSD